MAINPGEDEKMRMYIWNNIFFSFACDSRYHYKSIGGDEAAYVAADADLKGVAAYNKLDIDGLYTLGTVVVDYRGYRVIAQSIIPGNFNLFYIVQHFLSAGGRTEERTIETITYCLTLLGLGFLRACKSGGVFHHPS